MGKYLDLNNEKDMSEVEKRYQQFIPECESKAKEKTNQMMQRIKSCKGGTFSEKEYELNSDNEISYNDYTLYNLMTDEQIKKYLELYYIHELNIELENAKKLALGESASFFNKKSQVNKDSDVIYKVAKIELQDEATIEKRKFNRIALTFALTSSTTLFAFLGFIAGMGVEIAWPRVFPHLAYITAMYGPSARPGIDGIILFLTAYFTILGINGIKEFISNKRAIEEAKKSGLYDLIIATYKSNEELYNYISELKHDYNVPDEDLNENDLEEYDDETLQRFIAENDFWNATAMNNINNNINRYK